MRSPEWEERTPTRPWSAAAALAGALAPCRSAPAPRRSLPASPPRARHRIPRDGHLMGLAQSHRLVDVQHCAQVAGAFRPFSTFLVVSHLRQKLGEGKVTGPALPLALTAAARRSEVTRADDAIGGRDGHGRCTTGADSHCGEVARWPLEGSLGYARESYYETALKTAGFVQQKRCRESRSQSCPSPDQQDVRDLGLMRRRARPQQRHQSRACAPHIAST